MKIKSLLILSVLTLCSLLGVRAQNTTNQYTPIDFSLQLKNMHLWRGLQVSNSALTAVDMGYKDRSGNFSAGLWGGASFDGKFREFDYYVSYAKNGFSVSLWDIYNFSPDATYNNREVFNYEARDTGHFIDLTVGYRLQGGFPLGLSWSTIIFGRDRGADNVKNLYTTYLAADYPVLRGGVVDVDLGVAGAFALSPEKGTDANFYAKNAGIVNINITASKKVSMGSYVLPVSVMGMFNPANNEANLQIALNIF